MPASGQDRKYLSSVCLQRGHGGSFTIHAMNTNTKIGFLQVALQPPSSGIQHEEESNGEVSYLLLQTHCFVLLMGCLHSWIQTTFVILSRSFLNNLNRRKQNKVNCWQSIHSQSDVLALFSRINWRVGESKSDAIYVCSDLNLFNTQVAISSDPIVKSKTNNRPSEIEESSFTHLSLNLLFYDLDFDAFSIY